MKKLLEWLKSLFRNPVEKVIKKRKKSKRRSADHYGAHYYLGDLLDGLDSAFDCLPLFKKTDPEHYKMFSRIGCSVMSKDAIFSAERTANFKKLPSFGCFHLPNRFGSFAIDDETKQMMVNDRSDDDIVAQLCFMFFSKQKRPFNVQGSNQQIFQIGLIFMDKNKNAAMDYAYLSVSDTGIVTPLKICKPTHYKIKNSHGYVRMQWDWPKYLLDMSGYHKITPEEFITELFWLAVSGAMMQENGITVRVSKKKHSVSFSIDMLRTPYFFADRKKVVNENGNTKKIFHIVRGHKRKNGTFIKTHFRGLREFIWNDYQVKVGLAGLHRNSLFEFTGARHEVTDEETPDKFISLEDTVNVMEKELSR